MKKRIDNTNFPKNDNLGALSFHFKYSNLVNLCFLEGDFDRALNYIPSILKGIKEYKNQIDAHHVMMFNYKIDCI